MRRSRFSLCAALALLSAGCGLTRMGAEDEVGRRDRITTAEIRRTTFSDAYQLVSALRPEWLRYQRHMTSDPARENPVVVYLDEVRMGGAEFMRQLDPGTLGSLEFLSATEASARWGLNHLRGAILITTRLPR